MGLIRIGLTGGIASGKSTIAGILGSLGAVVIDADQIAHEVILRGTPAFKKILSYFGSECLDPKGEINRKKLGEIVFCDSRKRVKLNSIVHPEVFRKFREMERMFRHRKKDVVMVYDVPLLIESGFHLKMDFTLLVHVSRERQIERLMRRNGLTREESLRRIRAQLPFSRKRRLADFVVEGDESRADAKRKIERIFSKILREAGLTERPLPHSGNAPRSWRGTGHGPPSRGTK